MKQNDTQQLASLITALAPELTTAIEGDRQTRLRAAAKYLRTLDADACRRLIPVVCASMRISETVFRQILAE